MRFKESIFYKSLGLIRGSYKRVLLMFLIDILFFACVFVVSNVFRYLLLSINAGLFFRIIFLIVYMILFLFAYSFFKYIMLHFIKSVKSKEKLSFRGLKKFYFLNMAILGLAIVAFFLVNAFLYFLVSRENWMFVGIILAIPCAIVLYSLVNVAHSLFALNGKSVFKEGLGLVFKKIDRYAFIYLLIAAVSAIIYVLNAFVKAKAMFLLYVLIVYILLSFNRVYFYLIVEKNRR